MKPIVTYINPSTYTNIVYSRQHDSDQLLQQEYAKQGDIILETSTFKTGILRIHNTKFLFAGHIQYDDNGNIVSQESYDDRYLKVVTNPNTGKSSIDASNGTLDIDSVILKKIYYKDPHGNLMQFGHSEGDSFIIDNPFKIENFYVNGNNFNNTYLTKTDISNNYQSRTDAKKAVDGINQNIDNLNTSVNNKILEVSTWLKENRDSVGTDLSAVYKTIRDESTYLYDNSTGISVKNTPVSDITSLKKAITILLEDKYYVAPQAVNVTPRVVPSSFINGKNENITFGWTYNNYNYPDTSKLITKYDGQVTNVVQYNVLTSGNSNNIVKRLEVSTTFKDSRNVTPSSYITNMVCTCNTELYYMVDESNTLSNTDIINIFKDNSRRKNINLSGNKFVTTIGNDNKHVYFTLYNKPDAIFYIYEQGDAKGFAGGVEKVGQINLQLYDYPVQYTLYRTIQKLNTRNKNIIIEFQ